MCGIFGLLADHSRPIEQSSVDLDKGLTRIRHRGPDGMGKWVSDNGQVALGHVRLSIIDLETGTQPMHSDDGRYTIIYNGEIFNFIELRAELGDSLFRTHSDTEVVLRAFERWGSDCVTKLRGMFAIVIWDAAEQRLFLARDRFGIKPLYWAKMIWPKESIFKRIVARFTGRVAERHPLTYLRGAVDRSMEDIVKWIYKLRDEDAVSYAKIEALLVHGIEINAVFRN